jgi:hypothetical protein
MIDSMVDRSRFPHCLWAALNCDVDATPSEAEPAWNAESADHAVASESIRTRLVHVDVAGRTAAP